MKKVIKNLVKYTAVFLLILVLGLSNSLSNLGLKVKEAHAATLTYVGGNKATGANVAYTVSLTALTGGAGTTALTGDLVIVATGFTGTADGNPGVSTAGYTEEADLWANDTNDANFSVNWKIMGGTPDTVVTCNGSAGSTIGSVCAVHVWRNSSGTPMDVTRTTATGTNSTLFNSPAITPVTSGTVVISAGLAGMAAADTTITAPTGYGNQVDASNDPGTASTVGISSKAWTSGAEDPAAWTNITTTTADGWGAVTLAIRPAADTTTIGDGTNPGSLTIAPSALVTDLDNFSVQTDAGTDAITGLTVTLAAGTAASLSLIEVTSTANADVCTDVPNPAADAVAFTGCTITGTTTLTEYKVRITPKTHANMPVPPGLSYAVTGTVTAVTSPNTKVFNDTGSATITVDNLSPNGATLVSGTAGDTNVTVNWTTSNSADFDTTNGSIIYRWQAAVAGSETPDEGLTPTVGSADGTAIVACVISTAVIPTAESKVDGTGGSAGCTTAALTNGLQYTYKAFQRDTRGNYDVGVLIGTFTPVASTVITVDETGTQTSPLIIPSTGNYIGGAFTMLRGTGTANVTSITITESGTVDALNHLNNIKLQYDLDIVSPYNCASESYAVGDTQYGATDINGFSAANGTSAFTGSVAVSDVQAMCVYVVLDVLAAASDGQTMIVRITNPSTDVAVSAGTVEPSTAQGAGTTTLEVPKITVATEGTQANMIIGIGDNNVGGAFSFTRNTASANVTQIIITDTGTVNANLNISDVRVYYKPEGTCSSTIPVDATLFNSAAGSFNASEKTTVTGTMAVGTSKVCVYVRVDAGDGAVNAQTLEIEISNPSTEVTASAGSITPATAVAIAGTTTLNLPTYTSQGIPFLYTSINWGTDGAGVSFFLEVFMRQTTGTVYARLLNETDTTAVTGSTLSTTAAGFTRVRSAALTLTNGKTYRVQFGKIGADAGETLGAKLVVNQNGVGGGGGGADLAEYYSSPDQLDLAEVVSIDPEKVAGVRRSDQPYQKDMLGVVATQPGIILGENVGQSYPIALVGRVPVRVTTENGPIKAGDYLTSSSTPGHAMRATKAGRVLGQALEALDPDKKQGSVMVFVNLIDYLGSSVEMVMEDQNTQKAQNVGLSDIQGVSASENQDSGISGSSEILISSGSPSPSEFSGNTKQEQILAFLKQLKEEQASASAGVRSEIFTDRVSAVNEIITPHVITELLTAKKIKADSIEGLEILTDKISSLSSQVAGAATESAQLNQNSTLKILDLTVLGKLTSESGLVVLGLSEFKGNVNFAAQSTFQGETVFEKLVTFLSNVIFKGKVTFEEVPAFNKDTAGSAIVTKETDQVVIVFEKEYGEIPFVTVGITIDTADKNFADKTLEEQIKAQETLENDILSYDLKYFVTKRDFKGFVIKLNKKAPIDVPFSWHAIAVKDSIVFRSKPPVIEPTSVPSPILEPTIEPSITPSQEASSSAQ